MRAEKSLAYAIRLKTVIMRQNLHDVANVAQFAARNGMEVFYQAVEQNYNTAEDPRWFEHSENWPADAPQAVSAVRGLIALKKQGLPIRNSFQQLESMVPYFLNPDAMRVSVQQHTAHLKHPVCSALTSIQVMPNGDVLACFGMPPVGNIKTTPIRQIWRDRPRWWKGGALLDQVEERQPLVAVVLGDRHHQAQVGLDHLLLGVEVAALDALREVDLLLGCQQSHLADVLQEQLQRVGSHVGLQVERDLGLAAPALVRGSLHLVGDGRCRVDVLDQLDLRALEEPVQLLDVGLVDVEPGRGRRDLRD